MELIFLMCLAILIVIAFCGVMVVVDLSVDMLEKNAAKYRRQILIPFGCYPLAMVVIITLWLNMYDSNSTVTVEFKEFTYSTLHGDSKEITKLDGVTTTTQVKSTSDRHACKVQVTQDFPGLILSGEVVNMEFPKRCSDLADADYGVIDSVKSDLTR